MSSNVLDMPSVTRSQKTKVILALAIPAMVENFFQTVVGFVDTLFVSQLGLIEVAAVGVTNAILAVYIAVFMALGVGASSLIAKSVGAGDFERAGDIAKQSTWVASMAGILFGVVTLFFAEPLLRMMGAEPNVLAEGAKYFRIAAIPSIFISLMTVFGSILRAAGDTKTPMKVGLWINILHIPLDYVLIFGILGSGGFGIAGAAWATTIVRIIGTIALYLYIRKTKLSFPVTRSFIFNREYALPLLKLSTPAAIERLIMRFGQVLYFGLIVRIGTETYAAHTIAGNIEVFSYMPGYGLAVAATTLVGQHLGANRQKEAYQFGKLTTVIAVIFMSFIGVLLFFLSPIAASWFADETDVRNMVVTALRIDAFAQPFLAIGLVLAGALQGAGDTRSPMYSTTIGTWFIRVIGVYVLGISMGLGIAGVWLSIAIDLVIRALFLMYRFKLKLGQ